MKIKFTERDLRTWYDTNQRLQKDLKENNEIKDDIKQQEQAYFEKQNALAKEKGLQKEKKITIVKGTMKSEFVMKMSVQYNKEVLIKKLKEKGLKKGIVITEDVDEARVEKYISNGKFDKKELKEITIVTQIPSLTIKPLSEKEMETLGVATPIKKKLLKKIK